MYPIKLKPILKQHIWGGDALLGIKKGQRLRVDKSKTYGESWDVSGIEGINGSFFNVMGLPVQRLYVELGNLIDTL